MNKIELIDNTIAHMTEVNQNSENVSHVSGDAFSHNVDNFSTQAFTHKQIYSAQCALFKNSTPLIGTPHTHDYFLQINVTLI